MNNKGNNKSRKLSRREFVRNTALSAAAFTIVPRFVLGNGYRAPSDMLYVAGIGAGGKGESDIAYFAKSGKATISFLCDVDDRRAAKTVTAFPKAKYYKDYRKLIEENHKSFDAVSVSTPDHMHAVQAMAAMQLGKHVYVEKPLTHDIYEARMLTQAAQQYKVVTQMGNQGSSGDDTRNVETWIQAEVIGKVHKVHVWTNRPVWLQGIPIPTGKFDIPKEVDWDLWLGTAPQRDFNPAYLPATWR